MTSLSFSTFYLFELWNNQIQSEEKSLSYASTKRRRIRRLMKNSSSQIVSLSRRHLIPRALYLIDWRWNRIRPNRNDISLAHTTTTTTSPSRYAYKYHRGIAQAFANIYQTSLEGERKKRQLKLGGERERVCFASLGYSISGFLAFH